MRAIRSLGNRVFYGWWIVSLGCLINSVGTGIIYHSFSVFFLPLKRDLGLSSAEISLLYGAARLEGGIEGPIVGHVIDRFGPRFAILVGVGLAGAGLILLSAVNDFFSFFLIYVFVISFGFNAGFFHPLYTVVNKWFIRRRGIGFSLINASANVGGMVMAPLFSYILLTYGWRLGAVIGGILILVIGLPCAMPIRRSPEAMGLFPDGEPPFQRPGEKSSSRLAVLPDADILVRDALRTLHFWLLTVAISLRLAVTVALNGHFVPILVWKGMGEAESAYLLGLAAMGTILTALAFGWMGDRWSKASLSSLGIIPSIIAMVGLILGQDPMVLYFFPVAFAITMGTTSLNWALIGDFFGRGRYATLRGIMGIGYGVATFISPIFAGWVFDRTESYTLVLVVFLVVLVAASFIFAYLRSPRYLAKAGGLPDEGPKLPGDVRKEVKGL